MELLLYPDFKESFPPVMISLTKNVCICIKCEVNKLLVSVHAKNDIKLNDPSFVNKLILFKSINRWKDGCKSWKCKSKRNSHCRAQDLWWICHYWQKTLRLNSRFELYVQLIFFAPSSAGVDDYTDPSSTSGR